ncbi:MAG: DNA-binding domain-containing protein [bacterium]
MKEATFAAALLNPDSPPPPGLQRPDGLPAPKRFAVYRNNVVVGLVEALQIGFPAIRKLVGPEFFKAMAGEFVRQHPPQSRIMMFYGAAFPAFLSSFAPVAAYPYLPDVARLEQALRESYHAADATPIAPEILSTIPEATLLAARFNLAPALRLIRSAWPVHAIWHANMDGGPPPAAGPQDVLILRPDFDPRPHLLPRGGGVFIANLLAGTTLAEAVEASPDLDLPAVLALMLDGRALIGMQP